MAEMSHNSRIDIRVSNPEKEQWMAFAEAQGMKLTELIKQAMRQRVADGASNFSYYPPNPTWTNLNTSSGSDGVQITFSDPNG